MPSIAEGAVSAEAIEAVFRELLPAGVEVRAALLPPAGEFSGPQPSPRNANTRLAEHTTGRRLAQAALARLGVQAPDIPTGTRGMPLWPAGFTGSITHTQEICVAAVAAKESLRCFGIDVERVSDVGPELAGLILRPDEGLYEAPLGWSFSAKEAVFKCQFPITLQDAEFTDAGIAWGSDGRFRVTVEEQRFAPAREIIGAARQAGPFVLSVAWLP